MLKIIYVLKSLDTTSRKWLIYLRTVSELVSSRKFRSPNQNIASNFEGELGETFDSETVDGNKVRMIFS